MKSNEHIIKEVLENSIADELEIEAGDVLLKINNQEIEDIFDYQFLVEDEYIEVLIRKNYGEEWLLEVDKEADEDLGIVFENGLMGEYKSCFNKCIFCFIDQMPKGMRETLYFKDDDSRLSFLQGNYITLTNMKDKDIDRIIKYNLGPINISVHTTNKELRCKMLNNRFAGESLDKIGRLYEAGIEMNGQIVLCKGVNDKDELRKTIMDLSEYVPAMRSVSVVPAGLTKYRDGLYPLESFDKQDAIEVIKLIEEYQKEFYEKYGMHFIHASDEWYIMADMEFPEEERYDGYLQLENGVGMMRLMWNEFEDVINNLSVKDYAGINEKNKRTVSLATGVLAYDMISNMTKKMEQKVPGLNIKCYKIINNFFGEKITVSGLITATDLMAQLKGKELGECLMLPDNILRSGEDVFLDDYTIKDVEDTLGVHIEITPARGEGFVKSILGRYNERKNNGNFVYINAFDNE